MAQEVLINDRLFHAENFYQETITKNGQPLRTIGFEFEVTSRDYHDVTVLLYENDFHVRVPANDLDFGAVIHKYSTSVTNLYEENKVGIFKLELIQKAI
ncbi:DUF3219 family protein [Virgibacillus xinjiangensis]|uniref:DUF3219 family protein n=1 Tax=Virgibacillus xinjiangensis TaxID=393090 RepID=A0ABV7CZA1_9BACI